MIVVELLAGAAHAGALTDLRLPLQGKAPVSRTRLVYRCDGNGPGMGLPAGAFTVEYVNSGANHLALVPLHGETLVFSNVPSASGARYAAGGYIWWEAGGRGVTLTLDDLSKKAEAVCRQQDKH